MAPLSAFLLPWALAARPIDPNLLGFSSYAGPVVNLTYDDPSLMKVISALGVGSLRYPGGSPANNWNLTSGRWIGTSSDLARRTAAHPEGTFSPDSYMKGIGSLLHSAPLWNLNLVTLPRDEMLGQIDELKRMAVPVDRLELGNEAANDDCDTYLSNAALLVPHIRKVFPEAKIGIIGSWANPEKGIPAWNACEQRLKDLPDLYDAVTVHTYSPGNTTISAAPDWAQPTVTLAAVEVLMRYHVEQAKKFAGGKPVWLDEVNWGGPWMGDATWPGLVHGALRGLHYAANYLTVLSLPENAVSSLNWYSLLHQDSASWSYWASCAHVPDEANRPDLVSVDGVAQIYAHMSHVALRGGHSQVQPLSHVANDVIPDSVSVFGTTGQSCVQAALFSGASASCSVMLLNRCSWTVNATFESALPGQQQVAVSVYHGDGAHSGSWTLLDKVSSVDSPPWVGGPLAVERWTWTVLSSSVQVSLAPVALHVMELSAKTAREDSSVAPDDAPSATMQLFV